MSAKNTIAIGIPDKVSAAERDKKSNTINLTCICCGTETKIEILKTASIKEVAKKVFSQVNLIPNKTWHEWQYIIIKGEDMETMNLNKPIGENIREGGLFFMSIKAGTGA